MKTKRLNWVHIIIGVASVLMGSCATDDNDLGSDIQGPGYYEVGKAEKYEGVWFANGQNVPVDTAVMTIIGYQLHFSEEPFMHTLKLEQRSWADIVNNKELGGESAVYKTFSFDNLVTTPLFFIFEKGRSGETIYYSVNTSRDGVVFNLNNNGADSDILTLTLDNENSVLVRNIKDDQVGVFLRYNFGSFYVQEEQNAYVGDLDIEYKFISTKRLE